MPDTLRAAELTVPATGNGPDHWPEMSDRLATELEEIEITPEMIEVGLRELSNFDPDHDCGSEFVSKLYRVMFEMRANKTLEG